MPLMHSSDRRQSLGLPPAAVGKRLPAGDAASPNAVAVDSRALLEGRPRIAIRHRDETYWLHETRQGKLLLTK